MDERTRAYEDGVGDCVFAAVQFVRLFDLCSAPAFALRACNCRACAWRYTRSGLHGDATAEAARAAIYDEMADAMARDDHAAVMVGFAKLNEVTR